MRTRQHWSSSSPSRAQTPSYSTSKMSARGFTLVRGVPLRSDRISQNCTLQGRSVPTPLTLRTPADTWAMYDTLVASILCNTTFVVLDRPNPITGLSAFGPILNESYASYVGRRPIAQAHGMTAGELATMFVGEGWIQQTAAAFAGNGSSEGSVGDVKLQAIKMSGWERWMSWADTGLTWVMPSPSELVARVTETHLSLRTTPLTNRWSMVGH
jgi:hypothetical protein